MKTLTTDHEKGFILRKKNNQKKRLLLNAINHHAGTLKQLQPFVNHEAADIMEVVIHGLINIYEMHVYNPHLATHHEIEKDYKKIISYLNNSQNLQLPTYSSEKDRVITGMRKILPELIILARTSHPEQRIHIVELIRNIRDINATFKTREDIKPDSLKKIYLSTLHYSAKKLNVHRNADLTHVFTRAFRILGYVFTFGGLRVAELCVDRGIPSAITHQTRIGFKVEILFKEALNNPPRIAPHC